MSLTKGVNSYVTLAEADSYFEDRIDVAAWDSATDTLKEKALVSATSLIDGLRFRGQVVVNTQELAFPRSGSFMDYSRGSVFYFTSTYTFTANNDESEAGLGRDIKLLRKTTYELAYHLINNDGLLDKTGGFENIKVGPIQVDEFKPASQFPFSIRSILKDMLTTGEYYWRQM